MTTSVLYDPNKLLIGPIAFTVDRFCTAQPALQFKNLGVHVIWDSLTGTIDASIAVQGSNDGSHWDNLATPVVLSSANGNDLIMINNLFCGYYRVYATKNNVTGGTLTVIATLKE